MTSLLHNSAYTPLFSHFPYLRTPLHDWSLQKVGELSAIFQEPSSTTISSTAQNTIYSMVFPVFGHDIATALLDTLQKSSRIISTHHLCIDCLPEMVQAIHFLGLQKLIESPKNISIIPILACSGVSLQSYCYPRGLRISSQIHHGRAIHYPLYPSSSQNTLVYTAPPLTKETVLRMKHQWKQGSLSNMQWECIQDIVDNYVLHNDCLSFEDFDKQIMYCNAKIFQKIYPDNPNSHVIYLNLEALSRQLILHDLQNKNSILSLLIFNKRIRTQILQKLVHERACWNQDAIDGKELQRTDVTGTIFFWGIDTQGRRIPLTLREDSLHGPTLCHKDIKIPLTQEAICNALQEKRIYPNLFSSFVTLNLQHSLLCYGGIYMFRYLPRMLEAALQVLSDSGHETHEASQALSAFRSFPSFGSGIMSVQCPCPDGSLAPAGSIELMGHGGLKHNQLTEIANLSMSDLLPLTLKEWSLDHMPQLKNDPQAVAKLLQAINPWKGLTL